MYLNFAGQVIEMTRSRPDPNESLFVHRTTPFSLFSAGIPATIRRGSGSTRSAANTWSELRTAIR
jgi:hypothetical protein